MGYGKEDEKETVQNNTALTTEDKKEEEEKKNIEYDTTLTPEDNYKGEAYKVAFAEDDETEVGKKGDEDPVQTYKELVKQWNMNIHVTKKKIGMIQYLTGRLDLALKSRFS